MKKLWLFFWLLALSVQAQYKTLTIAPFKGLDLSTPALQLEDQSLIQADNAWWLLNGGVQTRPGFTRIGSTEPAQKTPWMLYRRNGQFFMGDSSFVWHIGNAGEVADFDSVIGYNLGTVTWTNPSEKAGGVGTDWAKAVQIGDYIASGGQRYKVRRVKSYDSLWIETTSGAVTAAAYKVLFNFGSAANGSMTELGSYVVGGSKTRGAFVLSETNQPAGLNQPTLLGLIYTGSIDSLIGPTAAIADGVIDNAANHTPNEWAGYWMLIYANTSCDIVTANRAISSLHVIESNTAHRVFTKEDLSYPSDFSLDTRFRGSNPNGYNLGFTCGGGLNRYSIFAPIGTLVDTFTIDTVAPPIWSVVKPLGFFVASDSMRLRGHIVEFLSGPRAGQFFSLASARYGSGGSSTFMRLYPGTVDHVAITSNTATNNDKGQKIALWEAGVSAEWFLNYNNQLVAANSNLFPNQVRFSNAGTIHEFAPLNFRVVGDRLGSQITGVRSIGGDIAFWQESDTWKINGIDLVNGQLIHALDGVGCPAPRTLKVAGTTAWWLGQSADYPTIFAWGGGGLKFNVVGQPSVYSGGDLFPVSRPIQPMVNTISLANIGQASAGFWQDHYLISVPDSGSTSLNHTYAYHIPTARWSTMSGNALRASLFYNASASPDTGQLYFTAHDRGRIFRFGGVETDTGAQIGLTLTTKDLAYQSPIYGSQLGPFELDFEKANTAGVSVQVFKNLPPTSATTLTFGSGVSGYRTDQKTPAGIWAKSFRLKLTYQAAQGIKIYGLRASYLPVGVP